MRTFQFVTKPEKSNRKIPSRSPWNRSRKWSSEKKKGQRNDPTKERKTETERERQRQRQRQRQKETEKTHAKKWFKWSRNPMSFRSDIDACHQVNGHCYKSYDVLLEDLLRVEVFFFNKENKTTELLVVCWCRVFDKWKRINQTNESGVFLSARDISRPIHLIQ